MSLAKSVEIVLSIAVCGGAVLAFGGAAYAADAGTDVAKTTAQVSDSQTNIPSIKPLANDQPEAIASGDPAKAPVPEASSTSTPTSGEVKSAPEKVSTSAEGKVNEAKPAPVTFSTDKPEAQAGKGESTPGSVVAPSTITVNVPVEDPAAALTAGPSVGNEAAEVKPAVLTIQPKITRTNPANNTDLASTVPSAPDTSQQPSKSPAPLQPLGLIGRLTATLAGSVVPALLFVPDAGSLGMAAALVVFLIAVLAIGRAVTFGAWLRKGGYAHAARSDVADAFASLFATPSRLGYVPADQPQHSPFLVVSDMKISNLFPTLSERRSLT